MSPFPFGEVGNQGEYQVYGDDPTEEYLQDEPVFCPACGGIDTQLSEVTIPSPVELWLCCYCGRRFEVVKKQDAVEVS